MFYEDDVVAAVVAYLRGRYGGCGPVRGLAQPATARGSSMLPKGAPTPSSENMDWQDLRVSAETWEAFAQALERPASEVAGLADLLARPSVFED